MITTSATSQNFQKKNEKRQEKKKSDVKYCAFVQRWPATALQKITGQVFMQQVEKRTQEGL